MFILENEVRQEQKIRAQFKRKIKILKEDFKLPDTANTSEVVDAFYRRLPDKKGLKDAYTSICEDLDNRKAHEMTKTREENLFYKNWERQSKFRIYPQTWIGNICLDAFVPAFAVYQSGVKRGYAFKGLGFEVDGPIHENEVKMKKDAYKTQSLNDLGVLVWRVTNEQVEAGQAPSIAAIKSEFGILCSRARARIWGRIHLITLLYHGSFGMVRSPQKLTKTVSKLEAVS